LQAAQEWGKALYAIHESIQESINLEMEKKYKAMDDKINKLIQNQTYKPSTSMNFYHGVVNKTNITFSDDELGLLNKGLKYNLSKKKKTEKMDQQPGAGSSDGSDTAAPGEQNYIRHQVAKNIKKNCTNNKIEVVHIKTYKQKGRQNHETNTKQVN
jgi:hypothetical protein